MNELREQYSKLSDNELLIMVYFENSNYTEEAIEIAKAILNERGLGSPSDDILRQAKNYKTQIEESQIKLKYKGIGGWLLLLILNLTFFSPILNIVAIVVGRVSNLVNVSLILFQTCFSVYAGLSLWKKRPYAVKIATIYLITVFALTVISIFYLLIIATPLESSHFIQTLAILIWILYLNRSKRVKATYGDWEIIRKKQLRSASIVSEEARKPEVAKEEETESKIGQKPTILFKRFPKKWKLAILTFSLLFGIVCILNILPPSPSTIFEREKENIVLIKSSGGLLRSPVTGTGFVVDSSGKILTNYHIIRGAYKCSVTFLNNETYEEADIISADAKRDIALLKINAINLSKSNLGNSDRVKKGNKCYVIGNPFGIERVISEGIISNIIDSKRGYRLIQMTAPVSPGSSGGPVYDKRGRVIGLTTSSLSEGQNLNFAVPINYAKALVLSEKQPISPRQFTENDAYAYFYSGLENRVRGEYNLATEQLFKSTELDPTLNDAWYWIGLVTLSQGDFPRGKAWLQYYIELERNNPEKESDVKNAENLVTKIDLYEKEKQIEEMRNLLWRYLLEQ